MQFKVPQFIDVEDKLFGPLTFKQFAYLAGGGGLVFVAYKLLPLTFYRINGQPFIYYLQASIVYLTGSKLYIWKQKQKKKKQEEKLETKERQTLPTLTNSKLKDLAWSLDIMDNKK